MRKVQYIALSRCDLWLNVGSKLAITPSGRQSLLDTNSVRPGGVSGYPRAWYRLGSLVRIPLNAYSYTFVATFSWAQIGLGKARQRDLATLDDKSTSSGISGPYARMKMKARTGREKGRHL